MSYHSFLTYSRRNRFMAKPTAMQAANTNRATMLSTSEIPYASNASSTDLSPEYNDHPLIPNAD